MQTLTFEQWLEKCDVIMQRDHILSLHDLPDWLWIDAFENGSTPAEAVSDYWEEYEGD